MGLILIALIVSPLLGFCTSLFFKNTQEKVLSSIAIFTATTQIILSVLTFVVWLFKGCNSLQYDLLTIYKSENMHFDIAFFYDKLSAIYMLVAAMLIFIVSVFSKYYMHRESGYKRFYNHFLLFFVGLNILLISGNFETLFLGWEIVGISSFLLIAFYRERYLPVKNAMKVLSYYRLGDIALIAAFWFAHHLFHDSIMFKNLLNYEFLYNTAHIHPWKGFIIGILFLQAAMVKSAQFPYFTWLPRAMEGPTVSSAIFYGSLSVHLGVFLLIRTFPIWDNILYVKILVILVGLITVFMSSFIGSVQPTAKTQIAYSSITQIGFMFIEIALGWHMLALFHFACNAFLRTYQLLTSPSIMSYLVHEQFFNYDENKKTWHNQLPVKLRNTLYMLSLKEWNLDFGWYQYIWLPFKKIGRSFHFMRSKVAIGCLFALTIIGVLQYLIHPIKDNGAILNFAGFYSVLALILILIAWTERRSALRAWIFIGMSQLFFMLSIIQQHHFMVMDILIYFSGIMGAFCAGFWSLYKVSSIENGLGLNDFHGHIYEHPKYGLLFLLCALTMIGFPISPTFLGYDILFADIEENHLLLLIISGFTFIFLEIAIVRIYARVFLGQHIKNYHEVAFRSS